MYIVALSTPLAPSVSPMDEQVEHPKTRIFELRDWRTSKFPLRLIIRGIFLTYMWSGMWQVLLHEECKKYEKN